MSDPKKNEFEAAGEQKQPSLVAEFFYMLRHHKKYWLVPIIVTLLVFGLIILLGGTSVAPFIYTLF